MRPELHFLALLAVPTAAFAPPVTGQTHHYYLSTLGESTAVASDFGSAMPEQVSPYERMGITEDQLALGINPEEVLTYCGT